MIRVTCEPNRITVRGHSGLDATGRDVVCAAATILIYALVSRLEERNGLDEAQMRHGYARIGGKRFCDREFALVRSGMAWLAAYFPKHLSLEDAPRRAEETTTDNRAEGAGKDRT